ncbi:hypothetical protein [Algoriphagus mannitolivorans]|uniref:hypothetical protein n=1 Tax=Algoriphagus mannitolivorans TaxID=226504 RepID=UPI00040228A2|nr:hypothetical protein [Algoriphagus mannitolivorans]
MRQLLIHIVLLALLFSCQEKEVKAPVWLNPSNQWGKDFPPLEFSVEESDWQAWLQTPLQPIFLKIDSQDEKLSLSLPEKNLWIQGQAILILGHKESRFHFPLYLNKAESNSELVDLRSPKTVNTDSSLVQQQMLLIIDQAGNIDSLDKENLFKENYLSISPKTGTYSSDSGTPLSSFYVASGTPVSLSLKHRMDLAGQKIILETGPLNDAFGNQVPDGTLITFSLKKGLKTWTIEAFTSRGSGYLELERTSFEGASVRANIAQVFSSTLILQP